MGWDFLCDVEDYWASRFEHLCEPLQQNKILRATRKLVKRCLNMFAEIAENSKDDYLKFYELFD